MLEDIHRIHYKLGISHLFEMLSISFEIPSILNWSYEKPNIWNTSYSDWNTRFFIRNTRYFENMWQSYSIILHLKSYLGRIQWSFYLMVIRPTVSLSCFRFSGLPNISGDFSADFFTIFMCSWLNLIKCLNYLKIIVCWFLLMTS